MEFRLSSLIGILSYRIYRTKSIGAETVHIWFIIKLFFTEKLQKMQHSCSRNTLKSNICCIVLNRQFRQSKKWSNNWPLSVKIFWFSRQLGQINSETHLYSGALRGERNEIRAARVFPLPLLRLMDNSLAAVTHSRSTPSPFSRRRAQREKNLKIINQQFSLVPDRYNSTSFKP